MIGVDRLVLDVPGMTPERATRLSSAIGALLADAAPAAAHRIAVTLPHGPASDEAILAALAAALGRRG